MDLHLLNGLTPEQLRALITELPVGFSAEDGSIQYLGRQIQLHDGMTALSGQTFNTTASKQLFERMVSLQPDFQQQLPGSTSEIIQMTARNLVDKFQYEAIEKSPTKEVLCAVFIEFMKFNIINPINTAIKLSETHSLTGAEKLRILLAAEDQRESPLPMECWSIAGIPLSIRLEEAKNRFQRLPATPSLAQEANEINEYLTALNPDTQIKEGLQEIRQTLASENNELSRQLLGEVDNIEKIFIARVIERGYFTARDDIDFKIHSRRLLHLYAACSGFSLEADIAELASYIRAVLYTSDYNIWHIANELAYLSKQPGSMNYCRYINAVANILKVPAYFVSQFEECKQLSDLNGFALLESKPLATYLMELRANIGNMTPEYSQVLLPAVNHLESKVAGVSLPEGKPEIKAKVHRLLMVIAACKSSEQIMDTSVLAHFVSVIMEHGNIKNIPYLISGLARLVQSTPKTQQILGAPLIKGGKPLRLAPLQLLAFVPDIISEANVLELNNNLQNSSTGRRQLKDGKVFHQWLVTLEQALASEVMNKGMVFPMLKKLSQSLTYEKLGLLHMLFTLGDRFNEFLYCIGFSAQQEGLPLLIAEKGTGALVGESKEVSQWLLKQRYGHLLPSYMITMTEYGNEEIIDLIHEFIHSSANNTFIQARQSPLNNPHLQAVYQQYPQFQAGWRANFTSFSVETRNKLLSPGETLELTEDPWDLFINGLEINTCQSPDGPPHNNKGLMSYVMDGRNAMIVRKSQKGNILSRSVIRMVLDQDDGPALFLEMGYPDKRDLQFIDAAREIAGQMALPLYHRVVYPKGEKVKLLEGRTPFDYFDSLMGLKERQEVTFINVQRDK